MKTLLSYLGASLVVACTYGLLFVLMVLVAWEEVTSL